MTKITPSYTLTFDRHKRDLEASRDGSKPHLRFNDAIAHKYVSLLQTFKHYKGEKAGQLLILEDWQRKAIGIWAGWEKKNEEGTWLRRFDESLWHLPKKNGKTIIGSGLSIVDTILRGEQGGEVYAFATKAAQASLAWDGFDEMLKSHDLLKKYYSLAYSTIKFSANNTEFKKLGKDSKGTGVDGISATFGLSDERHAQTDNKVRDNVKSSMISRKQPHLMDISTAGLSVGSPYYEDYLHAKKVVEGTIEDDTLFVFIAEAPKKPKGDEYNDWYFREEVWEAANPNYGVSVTKDFMRTTAKRARERPELLANFLTKHLNVWRTAANNYIDLDDWNACVGEVDTSGEFIGGLDLSLRDDFSSWVKLYKVNGKYHLKPHFYIPADTIQEREKLLGINLSAWVDKGYITATPGSTINYMYIYNDILEEINSMTMLGYDVAKAKNLIKLISETIDTAMLLEFDEDLDHENLDKYRDTYDECIPITQGFRTLSEPTILFWKLISSGQFVHDGNPCMTWMVSNMTVVQNAQDNVMPDKSHPIRKIDGVAATVNALALYLGTTDVSTTSIYETRGMRSL